MNKLGVLIMWNKAWHGKSWIFNSSSGRWIHYNDFPCWDIRNISHANEYVQRCLSLRITLILSTITYNQNPLIRQGLSHDNMSEYRVRDIPVVSVTHYIIIYTSVFKLIVKNRAQDKECHWSHSSFWYLLITDTIKRYSCHLVHQINLSTAHWKDVCLFVCN